MDVHVEPKPRKTFMGSAAAQTSQDIQTAGRENEPVPSEATLHDGDEPKEQSNTPEASLLESEKKPRVVADEAEVDYRTRTDSLLRVASQEQRTVSLYSIEEEDEDFDGEQDETDAISQDNILEEYIIDAIECKDESTVQQWLQKEGTKANEYKGGRASHGHFFVGDGTALHWAAYYGQLEIAKLLLNNGADPYEKAKGEETVLHWACQSKVKNKELVEKLLTVRTDDRHPRPKPLAELPDRKGWTPLHYACFDNNKELVQQLINAGADPNAKNDSNCTPLHLLNEDSDEILDLLDSNHLLPRTSDPVLQEDIIEKIKSGVKSGEVQGFQKWLDGRRSREEVNCYRGGLAIKNGLVLEGGTALHWAAYYGQFAIVKALTEKEADFCVLTSKKESVLHWACKGHKTNEKLVKLLLKKVDVNFADVEGYTALHYACLRKNRNIAELLLDAKADRTAQALHGETPVGIAFKSGKTDLIDLLDKDHLLPRDNDKRLESSIVDSILHGDVTAVKEMSVWDINRKRGGKLISNDFEVSGGTALHWAAYYGEMEIVEQLFKKGASHKVMDKDGETILHWACKSGKENYEMVEMLLEKYVTKRTHPVTGGEETNVEVDSTNSEGYTALHYACWQGHEKVVERLKEAKADPIARSVKGYTPLDFAVMGRKQTWKLARILDDRHLLPRAKFTRLEKCIIEGGYTRNIQRWLKSHRRNVDHCRDGEEGGTALHWAAYHGWLDIVKMLIENGANPRARAYDNGTVLHWACRSEEGNRELVRLLLRKGCKLDDRDKNGYTPFLLAASHGCQRVVEELLQWDRFRVAVNRRVIAPEVAFKTKGNNGHTPLVRASLKGHHTVVELLLKRGAKVEPQDLRTAIEEGNEHVVSDLLQSPRWPTLMHQCWGETTPFRELIKKMPDVAKQVLDRCIVSNPETRDPKNVDFQVVLDYSFVEDHNDASARHDYKIVSVNRCVITCIFPSINDSWCSSNEDSEPKFCSKKNEKAHEMTVFSNLSASAEMNSDLEVGLNGSLVEDHKDGHASKGDSKPKYYPEKKEEAHKLRFDEVRNHKDCTMKYRRSFKKSNHPLEIMVQHGRLEMLTHPVISSLLQHKWFHFGLWFYLLKMLIYIIFLVFLTAFAVVVLPPQSSTCLQVLRNPGISVCENETERVNSMGEYTAGSGQDSEMMVNNTIGESNVTCVICELSGTTLRSLFASAVIVILFVGIRLVMKACQLCYEPKICIYDWMNFFEVSLYILSVIFVSVFTTPCLCPQKWQWQIGVVAILLAWINLIRFCAKFPSTGIYIIMFGHIVLTFLNVIVLSVLLLTTFAITFYMILSEALFQRSPFYTPASSMLKILSMTAGDFSLDTIFRLSPSGESEEEKEILFPIISIILWIIFLIIMPLLFINMLIGLAVGDTSEIQKKAHLTKLALQVDMILTAEHLLRFLHIHKCFSTVPSSVIVTPNKREKFSFKKSATRVVKEIIYFLFGGEQFDVVNFHEALNYYQDSETEDQNKHIEALERMEERIQALEQLIRKAILQKQGVESEKIAD